MAVPPGESRFLDAVLQNPRVRDVLTRADALDLPDWYLAAGCLFQTVWNVLENMASTTTTSSTTTTATCRGTRKTS